MATKEEQPSRVVTITKRLSLWLAIVASVCLFVVIVSTTTDATMRRLFNSALLGSIEICELTLVPVAFFGLAWAHVTGSHVRLDFIFERLPQRMQPTLQFIVDLICLSCLIALAWAGIEYTIFQYIGMERTWAGNAQIPIWPFRATLALGVIGFCIAMIVQAVTDAKSISQGKRQKGA